MSRYRAIDLCAGAGGWAIAARRLPIDVVLAVDYWQPACETYRLNHRATDVWQADLTDEDTVQRVLEFAAREQIDLVLGGIPCEWISAYRRERLGNSPSSDEMDFERKLLANVLRIVRAIDPTHWCLEDVVALIDELPEGTPYQVFDARDWSAQRRKRVFVGNYPLPRNPRNLSVMRESLRAGPFRIGPRAAGRKPQKSRTFTASTSLGAWPDEKSPTVMAWSSRRDAEVVLVDPALPSGHRQIEWQEAAALQGFPPDYVFWGSPTDVGKMVGRAIQIDLGKSILQAISRAMPKTPRKASK